MSKILVFVTGAASGLYLCKFFSIDTIIFSILIVLLLPALLLGYVFHVGISDFQEYEK